MELDIKAIRELMECMNENKLDVLKIKTQDFGISLERHGQTLVENRVNTTNSVSAASILQVEQSQTSKAVAEAKGNVVKSPIVGTFYATPSPDKEPFVKVGSQVKKGDVLFIIESMKLMNEITSEYDGVVAEFLIENGKTVDYGQPILRIE